MTGLIQILLVAAWVAAATTGCSDASEKNAPDTAGEVAASWRGAGLTVSSFSAIDGRDLGGGECARGQVDRVEVTLCRYASEQAARDAQPAGLKLVGQATGSSLPSGKFLLVVADRDKADPDGKRVNQIIQTYRGRTVLVAPERQAASKGAGK